MTTKTKPKKKTQKLEAEIGRWWAAGTPMSKKSVTIWEAYVGKGAPSPTSVRAAQRGYGLTEAAARRNWARERYEFLPSGEWMQISGDKRQAPYVRTRRVTLSDHDRSALNTTKRQRMIAWNACGMPGAEGSMYSHPEFVVVFGASNRLQVQCIELIRNGKYATAVLRALTGV